MKNLFCLVVFLSCVSAFELHGFSHKTLNQFMAYAADYGKYYKEGPEFEKRFTNWINSDKFIKEFNSRPATTMTVAHNKFSDLSPEEF